VGLSGAEAMLICLHAGRNAKVRLMDVSEFNPLAESFRTGRLVANMLVYFVAGLAARPRRP